MRRLSGDMGAMFSGDRLGEGDGSMDCGGVDDGSKGDVSYERGDTRRLESSSPFLNNLTLHRLFLVHLAGGDFGGGISAVGSTSAG